MKIQEKKNLSEAAKTFEPKSVGNFFGTIFKTKYISFSQMKKRSHPSLKLQSIDMRGV